MISFNDYFTQKKELQTALLVFLNSDDDSDFTNLIPFFEKEKISTDQSELRLILHMVITIANNHYHSPHFYDKIKSILNYLLPYIEKAFTNIEIFELFSKNKYIINFLIEKQKLQIDDNILYSIRNNFYNQYYLFPEIKSISKPEIWEKISKEIIRRDPQNFENFNEKRREGENETLICSLIRNDSIDEFIQYVNETNADLDMYIKKSIFETNSFLDKNNPTLIEYAAFFGSIQIIKYLEHQKIELKPSIWNYSIHSNNPELIAYLIDKEIEPEKSYEFCIKEAIKCHHNEIVDYFIQNDFISIEKLYKYAFHYYNFAYFPSYNRNKLYFFEACEFDYFNLVKFYLDKRIINLNIKTHCILFTNYINEIYNL